MAYRSDPALWFNLPGVVAAYQPIGAPGPLICRYNQAGGGRSAYPISSASGWDAINGWKLGTAYVSSWTVPLNNDPVSIFVRAVAPQGYTDILNNETASNIFRIQTREPGTIAGYHAGIGSGNIATSRIGIFGLAKPDETLYVNGTVVASSWTANTITSSYPVKFGGNGITIQAAVIYNRLLSISEILAITSQMQWCHVNLDWSVWGRRRRWYYAPLQASVYGQSGSGADTPTGSLVRQTGKRVGAV